MAPFAEKLARKIKANALSFADFLAVGEDQFSPVFSVFWERVRDRFASPTKRVTFDTEAFMVLEEFPKVDEFEVKEGERLPPVKKILKNFLETVQPNYGTTRDSFGTLFDYERPSSSFLSPYLSAGAITVR